MALLLAIHSNHPCLAFAGSLGVAFAAGGPPAGLALLRLLLYLCSLPTLLPYAALATAYWWQLRAICALWAVFCGRRTLPSLLPLAAPGAVAPSPSPKAAAEGGLAGDEPLLPSNPNITDLTASILLLAPLLLLLPTMAAFYGLAAAFHCAWLAPRLGAALALRAAAGGARLGGASGKQQQPQGAAGEARASLWTQLCLMPPSAVVSVPSARAILRRVAEGQLVGARLRLPW